MTALIGTVAEFVWSTGGLTSLIAICALAWAIFIPLFRREAIAVTAAALALTYLQARAYDHGLRVKQAEWDAAARAASDKVDDAVRGADRDQRDGVRDPYDRDDP